MSDVRRDEENENENYKRIKKGSNRKRRRQASHSAGRKSVPGKGKDWILQKRMKSEKMSTHLKIPYLLLPISLYAGFCLMMMLYETSEVYLVGFGGGGVVGNEVSFQCT